MISRLIDDFRGLVFREDLNASEHKRSPRFGVVHCDEAGNLYRIDRETDQHVPIRPPHHLTQMRLILRFGGFHLFLRQRRLGAVGPDQKPPDAKAEAVA